jgi:OPT family small oligopeptide transporter
MTVLGFRGKGRQESTKPVSEVTDNFNAAESASLDSANAVDSDIEKEVAVEERLLEDNSPYPEVCASAKNYDEDFPANTIRAWVIGLILTTVGSAVNELFTMRSPSISFSTAVIQLIAYPIGRAWHRVMPNRRFKTFSVEWNLNPGPFNYKEHVVISIMANCSYGSYEAYATYALIAQQLYYGQSFGWGFQILFTVTTQMLGYGLAGLMRRFLVWPASMIWPGTLVNCSLLHTLHDHRKSDPSVTNGWSIGRYRLFLYIMLGSFLWYFFPGYIAQFLSYFVWPTWIAPKNVIINQLFGGNSGLGLMPMTFDWTVVTGYLGSPLIPPFFAVANVLVGVTVFILISALGIHYTGSWYSDYLPMMDNASYDNTGKSYNVSKILTSSLTFDEAAYKEYSPIFISTGQALGYGASFASVTAIIVHTALYHGKDIWARMKGSKSEEKDVHMKMMEKYPDVNDWWYVGTFVFFFGLSFAAVCGWETHFPWWAFIISILISAVFILPVGIMEAITNVHIGLNVLTEYIVGYMIPGRPLATMMFKTYGFITMRQALEFVQDMKLCHYMKVPPKTMFASQMVATIWSAIVQVAVVNWAIGSIPELCSTKQKDHYTCPSPKTFYTNSIIYGLIGPKRMFSSDAIYSGLQWYWLIGAIVPVIFWLAARRWPKSPARFLSAPVMFGGLANIPPATPYSFYCWGLVGFSFNFYVKRRFRGWWLQYNYITSAALDCGLLICSLVIFFALQYKEVSAPSWWGNDAISETLDMLDKAVRKKVGSGETFGPTAWS